MAYLSHKKRIVSGNYLHFISFPQFIYDSFHISLTITIKCYLAQSVIPCEQGLAGFLLNKRKRIFFPSKVRKQLKRVCSKLKQTNLPSPPSHPGRPPVVFGKRAAQDQCFPEIGGLYFFERYGSPFQLCIMHFL